MVLQKKRLPSCPSGRPPRCGAATARASAPPRVTLLEFTHWFVLALRLHMARALDARTDSGDTTPVVQRVIKQTPPRSLTQARRSCGYNARREHTPGSALSHATTVRACLSASHLSSRASHASGPRASSSSSSSTYSRRASRARQRLAARRLHRTHSIKHVVVASLHPTASPHRALPSSPLQHPHSPNAIPRWLAQRCQRGTTCPARHTLHARATPAQRRRAVRAVRRLLPLLA